MSKSERDGAGVADTVLEAVGNTPLIRLHRMNQGPGELWVKWEAANPGGSIKDRIAGPLVAMLEQTGQLLPGGLVVEATAGNTGVALAMACAVKGYRSLFVVPDKMSPEKVRVLEAYGATVVRTVTNVPHDHPDYYQVMARRLAKEIPGAAYAGQFDAPANPLAHEVSTGPEIWTATRGRVTHLVGGAGTGGTLTGTGRFLKRQNPRVHIVAADPEGSHLSGGPNGPYQVEGIGGEVPPQTFAVDLVDRYEVVTDAESFATARAAARLEGLLAGGSSGTALAAALRVQEQEGPEAVIVAIFPDTGRNYLSGFYDTEWLRQACPEALAIEATRWPLSKP